MIELMGNDLFFCAMIARLTCIQCFCRSGQYTVVLPSYAALLEIMLCQPFPPSMLKLLKGLVHSKLSQHHEMISDIFSELGTVANIWAMLCST